MSKLQRTQPTGAHELLSTKFALPRLRSPLVVRERLLARLDRGIEQKLTLLSAPAGFGKTTLVADWVQRGGSREAAWLLLDGGDNDPVRFWRYFITACRTFDAALGKPALVALRTAQPPSLEKVLTPVINELAQLPSQCILVLEDYHVITSPQVHEAMTFLVDHLPQTLHLVLMTRSQPPLPIARLRARNELCEINSLDLRFSREETQAFLQQALRVPLSPLVLARIQEHTEGWVTGLRLLALALHGRDEPGEVEKFVATFSGEHQHVMEYLAGEVLAALPESLQSFLLETSFLNRLSGSLCDAVLGIDDQQPPGAESRPPSQAVLEYLERANLFLVPLDSTGGWYRYHGLFAAAMRHYARQRLGQDHVRVLHERASLWFETQGLIEEALEAALAARQFSRAATLIQHSLQTRGPNELHTFPRWVEQLPEEVLAAHPLLCFNHAMALLFSSDRFAPATGALIETPLQRAEEAWRLEKNNPRLGQVFSLRSVAALWQGDLAPSFAYAHQALELLAEHDVLWRGVSLMNVGREELLAGRINSAQRLLLESRALSEAAGNIHIRLAAMNMLGETHTWQGEFDQAIQYYQQVLVEAVGGEEMLDDQGAALIGLSAIAYERNDLETAEQYASRALELGQRRADEAQQVGASLLLARVEQARGQASAARERLNSLAARARRASSLREIQAWQTWLSLAAGDLSSVERWCTTMALQSTPVSRVAQEREALILARLHLAQDDARAALGLLDDWRADAGAQGRTCSEIEILCCQALAYQAQSDLAQAEQTLIRALAHAQPRRLRRTFLDQGIPMVRLLQAIIPRLTRRPLVAYATTLLHALAPARTASIESGASLLLEPLSPQERRVLRLLEAGLSNPEIAQELIVSVNTVKTHVKNIYGKLDVHSREEAGEAAREMKLL